MSQQKSVRPPRLKPGDGVRSMRGLVDKYSAPAEVMPNSTCARMLYHVRTCLDLQDALLATDGVSAGVIEMARRAHRQAVHLFEEAIK